MQIIILPKSWIIEIGLYYLKIKIKVITDCKYLNAIDNKLQFFCKMSKLV